MHSNMRRELEEYANNATRKEAQFTEGSKIGKVTAINSGQRYDVQGTDQDATYEFIPNMVPRVKWKVGQWVTLEHNGITWQIVGASPVSGA